jgi:hypothetical protein
MTTHNSNTCESKPIRCDFAKYCHYNACAHRAPHNNLGCVTHKCGHVGEMVRCGAISEKTSENNTVICSNASNCDQSCPHKAPHTRRALSCQPDMCGHVVISVRCVPVHSTVRPESQRGWFHDIRTEFPNEDISAAEGRLKKKSSKPKIMVLAPRGTPRRF